MSRRMLLWCRLGTAVAILPVIVASSGCVAKGGKTTTKIETRTTTAGQELQDLQAARDQGAISEQEYQRIRSEIVKREGGAAACGCTGLEPAPLLLWIRWRRRRKSPPTRRG